MIIRLLKCSCTIFYFSFAWFFLRFIPFSVLLCSNEILNNFFFVKQGFVPLLSCDYARMETNELRNVKGAQWGEMTVNWEKSFVLKMNFDSI